MCLDIICPRWSLNLARYTALMSWGINWPWIRAVHWICCVLVCAEGGEEEGRGWLENLCHIFPPLSAETSVSPEFGLGAGWGKNWNTLFICTDRYVYALRDIIIPRLRAQMLWAFQQLLTKLWYQDLGRKILKHYIFEECFLSVCLETLNLDSFFKPFNGLKYPAAEFCFPGMYGG